MSTLPVKIHFWALMLIILSLKGCSWSVQGDHEYKNTVSRQKKTFERCYTSPKLFQHVHLYPFWDAWMIIFTVQRPGSGWSTCVIAPNYPVWWKNQGSKHRKHADQVWWKANFVVQQINFYISDLQRASIFIKICSLKTKFSDYKA